MQGRWNKGDEKQNLTIALEIIQELLNTTELNLDDMEEHTRTSIRSSYEFLEEASHNGYSIR